LSDQTCGVPGCVNDAVRVLVLKALPFLRLPLCAHHVRRAILYLPDNQVHTLVFPPEAP